MPVVEKIEALGYDVWFQTWRVHGTTGVTIWGNEPKDKLLINAKPIARTKIEAVYDAVVELIGFYNSQNLNNGKDNH